ncbi:MAG: NAD(+) diphosphatase [Alphaproteobacteria bacterium]|nr:NAD(+) diphosphatase [Alphaproteobacteria bacterium]
MIPFSGNPLDRASEKRIDTEWVSSRRKDPSSFILPVWRLQPFLLGPEKGPFEGGFLKPGLCESLAAPDAPSVLLGIESDHALFALDISASEDPSAEGPLAGLGHFRDMRAAAALLPAKDVAILGQAKAMIDWHQRHGFCARCGAATQFADAGYKRVCPDCNAEHFPRTDPVVIMLATHGDSCLVGRGKQFPRGMYSALAGFIEPGETIEEAVRRELKEEAGVVAGKVTYRATQPWPFPSSLMIGCFAEAESRDIKVDESELAEAIWLKRETARALINGERVEGLWVPPAIAIAHHLIKDFAFGT